ncbi:MAG TPA: L-seryl-tRNA(Sec) selenium transferase [Anaerolineaceae bacterium]|nr:L-seryl-tRNA(Sec) selenium transferase [Anaerolineaceae bacterium]
MNNNVHPPSIDKLLNLEECKTILDEFGHDLVVDALRLVIEALRQQDNIPPALTIISKAHQMLMQWSAPTLVPLVNATGVILHTNLGRAPLSEATLKEINHTSLSYSNLEFDLDTGKRGKRALHAEKLLTLITGAESAYVVNNNAAAVLLVLTALAKHKRVIVSRTQMVEIGGGFRVPDVMRQSGAKLVEIGTTNRLHLYDYENALQEPATMVLCAHHSNFKIMGFTSEPSLSEICEISHSKDVLVFHDLGSGALLDTAKYGLAHEPTVQESLLAGADVISFSGDKLLGGPQAGIIIGKKDLLDRIKKHPLARALRPDKLCLAGLSATLSSYLRGKAEQEIPIWNMLSQSLDEINARANRWKTIVMQGEIIDGRSMVGGGSLPEESLPTRLLALPIKKPTLFLKLLREQPIPIIARIEDEKVLFDPRTVFKSQDEYLSGRLKSLVENWDR